jgi:NitT/TauT family transport system ATP-binding protein
LVYQRFGVAVFLDRCSDGFGMDPMAFARFDDVSITFFKDKGDRPFTAVENFDLTIEEGEFFCLLGPSGCGKTTALNMLAGFDRPTSGQITLRGRKVTAPGRDRGVVFQGDDSLYGWLTAAENVAFGPKLAGMDKAQRSDIARSYLSLVGLAEHGHKFPHEMSGGMKQRTQIARVLANEPDMLLMDEPFAALDAQTRRVLQNELVRIWKATGKTVLFITHDIEEAIILGTRIGVMRAGPASSIIRTIPIEGMDARDRRSERFIEYYRIVHDLIEVEVGRSLQGELA